MKQNWAWQAYRCPELTGRRAHLLLLAAIPGTNATENAARALVMCKDAFGSPFEPA